MNLTHLNNTSKDLDIDGNKIIDTNYPSQWTIAYAIMKIKQQKNTVQQKTFNEYIFEGRLLQFLDQSIQNGDIVTTWDEKTEEFKYASTLETKDSSNYAFISLKEIFCSTVGKFI